VVDTDEFPAVGSAMALLLEPLAPLAQQWDRLSTTYCWMVIVPGPHKLDFIFATPHECEPPWHPDADNLTAIDSHFWDWVLWLASKVAAHKKALVGAELEKLSVHLLGPMGVEGTPGSLDAAVASYVDARDRLARSFAVKVPRALERAVRPAIATA
jgi:hypothetical protein